jgi:murein DD-endopeptidase MepM/ murein hydrolase activator NlpD
VVAARAGRVRVREYHGAAGYYLTIDGRGTSREYVYQHLEQRGRPREGERVRTGEPIGFVGTSGNASTCHLHFELWTAPGSYLGGSAVDPAPRLRRWDARS